MSWSSFFGALAGSVIGLVTLVGGLFAWDAISSRAAGRDQHRLSLEDILERRLQNHIVNHFVELFPGWELIRPEYPAGPRGRIDLLCRDRRGDYVVIELKKNKAPDSAVTQVNRYITWVKQHLAGPGQKVRGVIIAESHDSRLIDALARYRDIQAWTYGWSLKLDKSYGRRRWRSQEPERATEPDRALQPEETALADAEPGALGYSSAVAGSSGHDSGRPNN